MNHEQNVFMCGDRYRTIGMEFKLNCHHKICDETRKLSQSADCWVISAGEPECVFYFILFYSLSFSLALFHYLAETQMSMVEKFQSCRSCRNRCRNYLHIEPLRAVPSVNVVSVLVSIWLHALHHTCTLENISQQTRTQENLLNFSSCVSSAWECEREYMWTKQARFNDKTPLDGIH